MGARRTAAGAVFLAAIREALDSSLLPAVANETIVEPARLGESAALVGLFELSRAA